MPDMRPVVIVRDEATLYRLIGSDRIDRNAVLVLDRRVEERRRRTVGGLVERRAANRRRLASLLRAIRRRGFAIVGPAPAATVIDDGLA